MYIDLRNALFVATKDIKKRNSFPFYGPLSKPDVAGEFIVSIFRTKRQSSGPGVVANSFLDLFGDVNLPQNQW